MRRDYSQSDDIVPSGYSHTQDMASPSPAGETSPSPADQPTGQPAAAAPSSASAVKEFVVMGQNYSFAPSALAVKKGDMVKIVFKNADGVHDLRIDEFAAATRRIKTGEEDTITFVADKTGSFEFYCSIGSHRQMGMKGTLTVTE